jgi:hypothetical protein
MAFGDLTTLDDVKAWLTTGQNPFPDTDDALLTRLITAASQFIQTWLKRQIASSDWQELRDGSGGQRLVFANFPVTAVLALTIDGIAISPAPTDGSCDAGYVFSPTELALRGYVFTRRLQNVVVTYTAGYATTPPDVAQACIELVCRRYRERTRIGEAGRARSGDAAANFSLADMDPDTRLLLAQYRLVAPVSAFVYQPAPTAIDAALLTAAL